VDGTRFGRCRRVEARRSTLVVTVIISATVLTIVGPVSAAGCARTGNQHEPGHSATSKPPERRQITLVFSSLSDPEGVAVDSTAAVYVFDNRRVVGDRWQRGDRHLDGR
jgi:hypothetical protein